MRTGFPSRTPTEEFFIQKSQAVEIAEDLARMATEPPGDG